MIFPSPCQPGHLLLQIAHPGGTVVAMGRCLWYSGPLGCCSEYPAAPCPVLQSLKRKEKEYEHEMERLAREKIATQQRLAELKHELSQWMDVLEIDRMLRQTAQPEDDQASTSTASGELHLPPVQCYLCPSNASLCPFLCLLEKMPHPLFPRPPGHLLLQLLISQALLTCPCPCGPPQRVRTT